MTFEKKRLAIFLKPDKQPNKKIPWIRVHYVYKFNRKYQPKHLIILKF